MIAAPLDRTWLLANLPHQGAMNLLDAIVEWDDSCVRAVARNQRALDHPLRRGGELPSVCGIEYGAQAAAAHGALVSRTSSGAGVLASVRNVVMHADRLDDVPGDLDVLAERLGGDDSGVLYRFEVCLGRPRARRGTRCRGIPAVKKRALVTGGSGAIGSAICRRLAADGFDVIVHANRHAEAAERLAAEIGGCATAFDVVDAHASLAALESLLEAGPIQVLVNNAGVHDDAAFPGMKREQWERVIAVALDGFYNVTQPLSLPMIRTRWGRIINITSVTAEIGNRGQTNYAAAKGALHAATRSLARELASRGITVNCVSPGLIDTAMSAGAFDEATIRRLVPLQRAGTPDDVAHAVAFLASDAASYITGQILSVNGGMT